MAQRGTGDRIVGGGIYFQVSGLSRREPGSDVRVRVQVRDLNFTRLPHLYLNTRTRDLSAETWDLRMGLMSAGNIPVSGLPWDGVTEVGACGPRAQG